MLLPGDWPNHQARQLCRRNLPPPAARLPNATWTGIFSWPTAKPGSLADGAARFGEVDPLGRRVAAAYWCRLLRNAAGLYGLAVLPDHGVLSELLLLSRLLATAVCGALSMACAWGDGGTDVMVILSLLQQMLVIRHVRDIAHLTLLFKHQFW